MLRCKLLSRLKVCFCQQQLAIVSVVREAEWFHVCLQIYEGEVEPWLMSDYCTDTVPVLLRRSTFCRAFAADAKDFRSYNSWVSANIRRVQRIV